MMLEFFSLSDDTGAITAPQGLDLPFRTAATTAFHKSHYVNRFSIFRGFLNHVYTQSDENFLKDIFC